ncbi:hypothetical protein [Vibrio agarivorans]|uniref:hypothetical protein n=1 Tax=Vibrio agarivorans TaxID=153622 RepID=UPI0022304443|nr:hypothetical protein [Vibrio agarivorans]
MDFGFLNSNSHYISDNIEILPRQDIDRVISEVRTNENMSDGWIYPPLIEACKSKQESNTKKFKVFADCYTLPATHCINFHPYNPDKAKFLILGVGFFFGVYLSPATHYKMWRVAYEEGKLTGVTPTHRDVELALNYLARFYEDSSSRKRAGMFAAIHWFLVGQSQHYPWERFEAQYKVLDGLCKLSAISQCSHSRRPQELSEKYHLQLPNWATWDKSGNALSRLRNELTHEALYAGDAIGYAHPEENYDVEFSSFNTKLIAAILGIKSSYVHSSSQDRQYHVWDME